MGNNCTVHLFTAKSLIAGDMDNLFSHAMAQFLPICKETAHVPIVSI